MAGEARRRLAAIGRDVVAQEGGPAARRAAALRRRLRGHVTPAVALRDLCALPDWARLPRPAQTRLAREAALASISSALARSIDGAWLGAHAELAGEAAVQRAIDAAPEAAEARALPPVAAEGLEPRGFALLAAPLPAPLRPLLGWACIEPGEPPLDRARACVAAALEARA